MSRRGRQLAAHAHPFPSVPLMTGVEPDANLTSCSHGQATTCVHVHLYPPRAGHTVTGRHPSGGCPLGRGRDVDVSVWLPALFCCCALSLVSPPARERQRAPVAHAHAALSPRALFHPPRRPTARRYPTTRRVTLLLLYQAMLLVTCFMSRRARNLESSGTWGLPVCFETDQ